MCLKVLTSPCILFIFICDLEQSARVAEESKEERIEEVDVVGSAFGDGGSGCRAGYSTGDPGY
jgi:hypothetical protein